jgi:lipopolysaccharide/colanic/teichoic acid biosynthesis glycosyltransferase
LLAATGPAIAAAAVGIRLSSPGPVIFRAERAGRDGIPFTMYKLRTMHVGANSKPITGGRDPRIFAFGSWLRRLKIDELPQLWNVVRGEMRFFGPRPEDVGIVREHYAPWMRETLQVPPGIVGPGSLGYYLEESELDDDPGRAFEQYLSELLPRKLARDLVYVRTASRGYRFQLGVRTFLGIIGLRRLVRRIELAETEAAEAILASTT